jgi:hypothetical protein
MSRIYASGNRTTAIANLKSDIAAFVITGADGIKRLDVQGMNAYLIAQFALLSTTDGTPPSPADATSVAAAAQTVNTQSITDVLNNQIKPEVFMSRSDWPQAADLSAGVGVASAVAQLQGELQVASQAISDYYGWLADTSSPALDGAVQRFMADNNIDSTDPSRRGSPGRNAQRDLHLRDRPRRGKRAEPAGGPRDAGPERHGDLHGPVGPDRPQHEPRPLVPQQQSNIDSEFQFVDEVASGADLRRCEEGRGAAEPCPTIIWTEPRANLSAWPAARTARWPAASATPSRSACRTSPYAWPREYEVTLEYPFVGCIACDAGWFVARAATRTGDRRRPVGQCGAQAGQPPFAGQPPGDGEVERRRAVPSPMATACSTARGCATSPGRKASTCSRATSGRRCSPRRSSRP